MPSLPMILDDLGQPSARALSALLGVSVRTVRRWQAQGHAPRPVMLALFWITRWGQSQVECEAVNDARLAAQMAKSHAALSAARLSLVDHLLRVGDFAAANAPVLRR